MRRLLRRSFAPLSLAAGLAIGAALAQERAALGPFASERSRALVLRLRPGQDLRQELLALVERERIEAAVVLTCVGSLERVTLRFADRREGTALEGRKEIVSLVGTLSPRGAHLHLAVSDEEGRTTGGHLLEGSRVYTTAEVALLALDDLRFRRAKDPDTGFEELAVERR